MEGFAIFVISIHKKRRARTELRRRVWERMTLTYPFVIRSGAFRSLRYFFVTDTVDRSSGKVTS